MSATRLGGGRLVWTDPLVSAGDKRRSRIGLPAGFAIPWALPASRRWECLRPGKNRNGPTGPISAAKEAREALLLVLPDRVGRLEDCRATVAMGPLLEGRPHSKQNRTSASGTAVSAKPILRSRWATRRSSVDASETPRRAMPANPNSPRPPLVRPSPQRMGG